MGNRAGGSRSLVSTLHKGRTESDHRKSRTCGWTKRIRAFLRSGGLDEDFPDRGVGKEETMDFAIILIVGNTLLAVFIYLVVTRIWQD